MENGTTVDEQLLQFTHELGCSSVASSSTPTPEAIHNKDKYRSSPVEATDVWVDISNALDNWLDRVVDIESRFSSNTQTTGIDQRIERAIQRMLEDGLLNICDAGELRFVGDSWLRLLNAYSCYSIGCTTYKHDIYSSLLDLFTAKQISRDLFICICEQL